jgi:hypothetical protein
MDRLRLAPERHAAAFLTAAATQAVERRRALGLFLRHLARGEAVAHAAADAQARLTGDPHAQRFFRAQARQEALHRHVFDTAAMTLRAPPLDLRPDPYARFRISIAAAAERGRLLETVVATQVVLEALGEALLVRLEAGLVRHHAAFPALRRRILAQELAHHAFGVGFVAAGAAATVAFDLAPGQLAADFRERLPAWAHAA